MLTQFQPRILVSFLKGNLNILPLIFFLVLEEIYRNIFSLDKVYLLILHLFLEKEFSFCIKLQSKYTLKLVLPLSYSKLFSDCELVPLPQYC